MSSSSARSPCLARADVNAVRGARSIVFRDALRAFTFHIAGSTVLLFVLSGFFFELYLMPPVMQRFNYMIPLTYFIEILRGTILRGARLFGHKHPRHRQTSRGLLVTLALAGLRMLTKLTRLERGRVR